MASLDILCSNPLNLKNKIMKTEHKKIFCGPSKNLKNISWPINIRLKYFMTSTETLRAPPYIPNVRSLTLYLHGKCYRDMIKKTTLASTRMMFMSCLILS